MSSSGGSMLAELMTYTDLALRWGVCDRQARRLCRSIGLRPLDLGHRTKRFRPADVLRAEERRSTPRSASRRGWVPREE